MLKALSKSTAQFRKTAPLIYINLHIPSSKTTQTAT